MGDFFYLADIPDFIIHKKVSKPDFEDHIAGFLREVKVFFLRDKAENLGVKDASKVYISDDDKIPFSLLDEVNSVMQSRFQSDTDV